MQYFYSRNLSDTHSQSINYINNKQYLIMSNSLRNLISTHNLNTSQPVICQIINNFNERKNSISLAWIPGHVGITGNEKVDLKAKETTATTFFEVCPHISDKDLQNSTKFKHMDE